MPNLDKILKFADFINDLRKIERSIYIKGGNRKENDSEHQYQLAMLAWYMVRTEKLKMNMDKILKYSLAHDLVEIYAGDTDFFGKRHGKVNREKKALERMRKEFPEFGELHKLIHKYEKRNDKESKFVYELDKLIPIFNIYLDNGRTWKKKGVTLSVLTKKKREKIRESQRIRNYFEETIKILKRKEKKLFG